MDRPDVAVAEGTIVQVVVPCIAVVTVAGPPPTLPSVAASAASDPSKR